MKQLIWLDEETSWFPDTNEAFDSPNGLLAAGGDLSPARLLNAYSRGIFPWYSENEPILWWTPNPRMVIVPEKIHLSRSLKKHWRRHHWRLSLDKDFSQVIRKCSEPRSYSSDTWISPDIKQAYIELHLLGYAHSIEVWNENNELIGGLYGVALGKVFFGESMFSNATNASKIAISALSHWLTQNEFNLLDCQVANPHLESLGGSNIDRDAFEAILQRDITVAVSKNIKHYGRRCEERRSALTDLSNLKLFATQPHECSYLPEKEATTLFVDPSEPVTPSLYSELSHYGFRRSGLHLYRPHCGECQACIPIRLRVEDFKPSRNQKRCLKRNSDLKITVTNNIKTSEHYGLYEHYINERHHDGDMYPASEQQYDDFLQAIDNVTHYLEFRQEDGKLIGVAVSDRLENSLSAIYTFFDPDQPKRSLGVLGVLAQIQRAQALQLDHVYLGYWIKRCQKMSYKSQYRPFQVLINNQWISVN